MTNYRSFEHLLLVLTRFHGIKDDGDKDNFSAH